MSVIAPEQLTRIHSGLEAEHRARLARKPDGMLFCEYESDAHTLICLTHYPHGHLLILNTRDPRQMLLDMLHGSAQHRYFLFTPEIHENVARLQAQVMFLITITIYSKRTCYMCSVH